MKILDLILNNLAKFNCEYDDYKCDNLISIGQNSYADIKNHDWKIHIKYANLGLRAWKCSSCDLEMDYFPKRRVKNESDWGIWIEYSESGFNCATRTMMKMCK